MLALQLTTIVLLFLENGLSSILLCICKDVELRQSYFVLSQLSFFSTYNVCGHKRKKSIKQQSSFVFHTVPNALLNGELSSPQNVPTRNHIFFFHIFHSVSIERCIFFFVILNQDSLKHLICCFLTEKSGMDFDDMDFSVSNEP